MKSASKSLGLLILILFLAAYAQAATVTGSVKSPDGTPFRGAFVQAQNTGTRVLVSVLTDKDGRYRIENLPVGKYQVQVKAVGYRTDPRTDVSLAAEQNATFDFALQQGMVRWSDLPNIRAKSCSPMRRGRICSSVDASRATGFSRAWRPPGAMKRDGGNASPT